MKKIFLSLSLFLILQILGFCTSFYTTNISSITVAGSFVQKSGDTMTGTLTAPNLATTGNISVIYGISAATATIGGTSFLSVLVSTGAIQTSLNNVIISTGALETSKVNKSGDTMTGTLTISGAGISASTGVFNSSVTVTQIVTAKDFVATDFAYGIIASSYNTTAMSLSNVTYSTMTIGISSSTAYNITTSTTTGTMTIINAGIYDIFFELSASGTNVNDIHGGLSINGAEPSGFRETSFTLTGAGNYSGLSNNYVIRLNAGDIISTQWKNTTAANSMTPEFYRMTAYRISS